MVQWEMEDKNYEKLYEQVRNADCRDRETDFKL